MQILIPMAGYGSRFVAAGYTTPKPLIPVFGKPMIQRVVENLGFREFRHVFVVLEEHYAMLSHILYAIAPYGCRIVTVPSVLPGAAHSCLAAAAEIDPKDSLLIANCDQLMLWSSRDFWRSTGDRGLIFTFQSRDSKNSYVRLNEVGRVLEVREKEVISTHATCGVYYWWRAVDMLWSCQTMIDKGLTINNEAYIAPSYNELIANGAEITTLPVMRHFPIGTPEDLERFHAGQ